MLIPETDFVNTFSLSDFFVLIINSHYICRFFPQIKTPAPNVARAGGSVNAYFFLLFAPMKKHNPAKTGAPCINNNTIRYLAYLRNRSKYQFLKSYDLSPISEALHISLYLLLQQDRFLRLLHSWLLS